MASQEVIEKLGKLQIELETVSNAVKHIDKASKVADTAVDILKKIPELLADLKSVEEKHRKDLLKHHKEKIDAIETQLQSLLTKLKQLNQIIDKTEELKQVINDYIIELREINFPEKLENIDNQISSINIGVGNLQTSIQRSQEKIDNGFNDTNQNLRSGFSSTNESIKQSQQKIINDIINHLSEENQFLKKEIKTNRIIQIVGLTIILIILIYVVINH